MLESRMKPIDAAQQFIEKYFPNCDCALLAGSVVRNEATSTSDLDIVVFDDHVQASYRESFIDFGWPIEAFVHNFISYQHFFKSDYERARPSLAKMISEGIVLKDHDFIKNIKKEANVLLKNGPKPWSNETIMMKRYMITDLLYDFIGSSQREVEIVIASHLLESISEFVLRTNRKWVGTSKWLVRTLEDYDKELAHHFFISFDEFFKTENKQHIIQLVDMVLEPFGGRLFAGFNVGKDELLNNNSKEIEGE